MKKKLFLFFMLIVAFFCFITAPNNNDNSNNLIDIKEAEAANISSGKVLYLKPNSNWTQSSAWFAAYFFNDTSGKNAWAKMTAVPGNAGYYSVIAPSGDWEKVIFCRMNSADTLKLDWSNKWDQTNNLTFDGSKDCYTIAAGAWSNGSGTWSDYSNAKKLDYVFLKPTSLWDNAGAWFAVYFFNDVNNEIHWVKMTEINDSGVYSAPVPEGYYKAIYCRMKSSDTTTLDWSNKWNQTSDSTTSIVNLPTDGNNLLTITSGTGDSYTGTWSTYSHNGPDKLYFAVTEDWGAGVPRYAAFFFGNGTEWVDMTKLNGINQVYEVNVPNKKYPFVIFARMSPSNKVNDWAQRWTQTVDLTIPKSGVSNCFTISAGSSTSSQTSASGTWSQATPDTKTIYFATNQNWANAYVNIKLNSDANEIWYNATMTQTGDIYRNDIGIKAGYNKIFSVTIPTLYAGVEEMQFDYDISDGFTGAVKVVSSRMDSSEYGGKLYYLGVGEDAALENWKPKVTTVFYEPKNQIPLATISNVWLDDKISAPTESVSYEQWNALYGWYRSEDFELTDKCYNYKMVDAYNGAYYAAKAQTKRIYFATASSYFASGVYAHANLSNEQDIKVNLEMKTNSDKYSSYLGKTIYYADIPLPFNGISELEFHEGGWAHKYTVTIPNKWLDREVNDFNEHLFYFSSTSSTATVALANVMKAPVTLSLHKNDGTTPETFMSFVGDKYTLNELSADGKMFVAWYNNEACSGDKISGEITLNANSNDYYALWLIVREIYFVTNKMYYSYDSTNKTFSETSTPYFEAQTVYFNIISEAFAGLAADNKFTNQGIEYAGFTFRGHKVYSIKLPVANSDAYTYDFVIDAAQTQGANRIEELTGILGTDLLAENKLFFYNAKNNVISTGWKSKVGINLEFNNGNKDEAYSNVVTINGLYEDDFYFPQDQYAEYESKLQWADHYFLGWYQEEKLASKACKYSGAPRIEVVDGKTYYALWAELYEAYFATNKTVDLTSGNGMEYIPHFATISNSLLSNYYAGGTSVEITDKVNFSVVGEYLGKYKIYSMQIPVVMEDFIKDADDIETEGKYKININVQNSKSGDTSRIRFENDNGVLGGDIRSGKLYYFDVSATNNATGWKSKVTTIFHLNDGQDTTESIVGFEGETLNTPVVADIDNDKCVGWSSDPDLAEITNPIGTGKFSISVGITDYYAIWATYQNFYFATNAKIDGEAYVPYFATLFHESLNDIPIDGSILPYTGDAINIYSGNQIYIVRLPLLKGLTGTTYDLRFNVAGELVDGIYAGGGDKYRISLLDVDAEHLSNADKLVYYYISDIDSEYDYQDGGNGVAYWKERVTTDFYSFDSIIESVETWDENVMNLNDVSDFTLPDSNRNNPTFFTAWYKKSNGFFYGSGYDTTKVTAYDGDYHAYYSSYFVGGDTIYVVIPNSWETYTDQEGQKAASVGIFLWGDGLQNFVLSDATLVNNPDNIENKVYKITIPGELGSKNYYNLQFLNTTASINSGYNFNTVWTVVDKRSSDLTNNSHNGYDMSGNSTFIIDKDDIDEYCGSWFNVAELIINNIDGADGVYHAIYVPGRTVQLNYTTPKNVYSLGWVDEYDNRVAALNPTHTLFSGTYIYTIRWKDVTDHISSGFYVKYKETTIKENSYGVVPIYACIEFDINETLPVIGQIYELYFNGQLYDTYTDYEELVADFNTINKIEFITHIYNQGTGKYDFEIVKDVWTMAYSFEVFAKDEKGNVILNVTKDSVTVGEYEEEISAFNYVDQYIYKQVHGSNYTLDLINDYEDKAMYQLHIHTFGDEEDVNRKYINDALYLYKHCYACDYKERVIDEYGNYITVTRSNAADANGQYTYTASVDGQNYSFTSINGPISYIFEGRDYQYAEDTRNEVYGVYTKDHDFIASFKSLYDAIEAAYEYDQRTNSYDPTTKYGSYVVKIDSYGEPLDQILFRNKKFFASDAVSDMYWFYENGTSLQRYGEYKQNYWTSILKSSAFTTIQRKGDLVSSPDVDESELNVFASSYKVFASTGYVGAMIDSAESAAWNYCYGIETSVNIFLKPSNNITDARVWLNLSDAEIYPSYTESDKAWAYTGFVTSTANYILHQGLKCDTTNGNWYYYYGIVTNTENGVEIKELEYPGVTDICYLTSTWDSEKGCFKPDEDIMISIATSAVSAEPVYQEVEITSADFSPNLHYIYNGSTYELATIYESNKTYYLKLSYDITSTLGMNFEDGRSVEQSCVYKSIENAPSLAFNCGLDIDTNDDLADFMCGAEFKNVVITYAEAETANGTIYKNIHNAYNLNNNNATVYALNNNANYNSVLYNNPIASFTAGTNGIKCDKPASVNGVGYDTPIFVGGAGNETYYVPIYNFSYKKMDNNSSAFAGVIEKTANIIQSVEDVTTIVEEEYYGTEDSTISYAEYISMVHNAQFKYSELQEDEIRVLDLSYGDEIVNGIELDSNLYKKYLDGFQSDLDFINKISYYANGNVYTDKNKDTSLGGYSSFDTKTNTYSLLISLPLWGRIQLFYEDVLLTTSDTDLDTVDPSTDQVIEKHLIDVTGLFSPGKASWDQRLYTTGVNKETGQINHSSLYCSNVRGSSYILEFTPYDNPESDRDSVGLLNIKPALYSSAEFVGNYESKMQSTGQVITVNNRLTYSYYDGYNYSQPPTPAKYYPDKGVYIFEQTLDNWRGVLIKYDGVTLIHDKQNPYENVTGNTTFKGLFHTDANLSNMLYHFGSEGGIMKPLGGTFSYRFVYDPLHNSLYIMPVDGAYYNGSASDNTIAVNKTEKYSTDWVSGVAAPYVAYWKPGSILHSEDGSWNKVVASNGTAETGNHVNGYRLYIIADKDGKIRYSAYNPTNGYGMYYKPTYYVHPDFEDYRDNTDVIEVTNDGWVLKVPEGGCGVVVYGSDNYNWFANRLSQGKISQLTELGWNARNVIDDNIRLKYDSTNNQFVIYYENEHKPSIHMRNSN